MPTLIGHSITGLSVSTLFLARPYIKRVGFLCVICSVIPDLDAIGFCLGIPYEHWLGHRGFSHSILFAVFFALRASLFILDIEKSPKKRGFLLSAFFICVVMHDILDAMTNGGLGVSLRSRHSVRRVYLRQEGWQLWQVNLSG